jgi:hypothetical protein
VGKAVRVIMRLSGTSRTSRCIKLAILGLPLLAVGECVTIAQESAINGFFDGLTRVLVARMADELSLASDSDFTVTPAKDGAFC